jgi:hypothetical protein
MLQDYTQYKFTDYLADDFFVKTMISPTPESKLFWSELIDKGAIDVDEFLSASILVKSLQKNKPEIHPDRIEQLWQRIDASRHAIQWKKKRVQLYKWLAVAACCAALIGGSLTFLLKKTEKEPNIAQISIIEKQLVDNDIRIVSGDRQMEIDGNSADIRYNQDGSLAVNDKIIVKKNEAPDSPKEPSYCRLDVPYGKQAQLMLSDSSILYVNSGTSVTYPAVFREDKREIYVTGEIYAEIRRDEKRPFIVKTDRMDIQVLGTSFDVSAYKEDNMERVVLVSGAVDVGVQGNKLHLNPNQAYTYMEQEGTLETVDVEFYTSWRDGIYIFKDESIEHILLRLARYYNVTLILTEETSGIVCSGKLELKDDLSTLLSGLSQIASFNFAVKEDEYRILFY